MASRTTMPLASNLVAPLLLLLLLLSTSPTATALKCAKRRIPLDEAFCARPPVVRKLDLTAYAGQWYQVFTTGFAGRFSGNRCVTANYTLNADNTIGVLNCQQSAPGARPVCVRARAFRRFPDNATDQARLAVQFFAGIPPGQYNVAALLGNRAYGYYAAAVFSCEDFATRQASARSRRERGEAGGPPPGVVPGSGGPPPGVAPGSGGPPPGVLPSSGNGTTGGPPPGIAAAAAAASNGAIQLSPGFFIIARTPWAPVFMLNRMRKRLRCLGYDVPYRLFETSPQPASCMYQRGEGSFDVRRAIQFTAPATTSVSG